MDKVASRTAQERSQLKIGKGCHTVAEYDLAQDAWFMKATDGQPLPWAALLEIALSTYLLKVVVALADTPFIYLARRMKDSGSGKKSPEPI